MIISAETAGIILRSDTVAWHKPEKSNNNKIKLLPVCKFKKKEHREENSFSAPWQPLSLLS